MRTSRTSDFSHRFTGSEPSAFLPGKFLETIPDRVLESGHFEISKQPSNLPFGRFEVHIALEPPRETHRQSGVRRIDFSRMDVKNYRTAFLEHAATHLLNDPERRHSEIASTEETNLPAK